MYKSPLTIPVFHLLTHLEFRNNKNADLLDKPFFYISSKKAFYQGDFNHNKLPEGYGIAIF